MADNKKLIKAHNDFARSIVEITRKSSNQNGLFQKGTLVGEAFEIYKSIEDSYTFGLTDIIAGNMVNLDHKQREGTKNNARNSDESISKELKKLRERVDPDGKVYIRDPEPNELHPTAAAFSNLANSFRNYLDEKPDRSDIKSLRPHLHPDLVEFVDKTVKEMQSNTLDVKKMRSRSRELYSTREERSLYG